MFMSEMIVGLWFVPVVLFIIIPLSMLCLYAVHKLVNKVAERIEQTQQAEKCLDTPRLAVFTPRHAV